MGFKVYINEGEWDQICDWVLKHNDIETGGDLFGLWLDEQTAVVQFVLGPGKDCGRTTTSFFQDVNYLYKAGTYLTTKQGLSNIGQWHSHHKIHLFEPSFGDKNTVWNNMPGLGMDRYIVFIANITGFVTTDCFLFQIKYGRQLPVNHGKFELLAGNSPLRLNEDILRNVFVGAESFNEMSTFESEMKFLRNKDARDENVSPSGYFVRGVEHHEDTHHRQTSVASPHAVNDRQPGRTGKPKERDKTSRQKLSVSYKPGGESEVVIHGVENNRNVTPPWYGSKMDRSGIRNNQHDYQKCAETSQSRNTVQNREVNGTPKQKVNRSDPFPRGDITGTSSNFGGISNETRREHEVTTPKTTHFDAKTLTTPYDTRGKQKYQEATSKTSRYDRNEKNATAREYMPRVQEDNEPRGRKDHGGDYNSPTKSKDTSRQRNYNEKATQTTRQYQKTAWLSSLDKQKTQQIIDYQPESSSYLESSRQRKSGDYDNVTELYQPKNSKANPDDYSAVSYDNRPSTPSGTLPHEEDHQNEATASSCLAPHCLLMERLCCMMRRLNITEQHSADVNTGSQDEKDVEQNEIPVTRI